MSILKNNIFFVVIFIVYISLHFFYGEFLPPIWPDEVLFFSAAKNLIHTKILKTDVLEGVIYGMDQATLWIPPLHLIVLSFIFFLFGESLFVGRTLSLFFGVLVLSVFYKLLFAITKNKKLSLFFMFLLSIEYSLIRSGNIIRMEILNLLLILTSLYFLEKKQKIFTGIFLGLSGLTHPISIFLIFIVFFYFRKLKDILIIGSIAFVVMTPWFVYIYHHLDIFQFQFLAQLNRKSIHYNYNSIFYLIKVLGGQFLSKMNFVLVYAILVFAIGLGILYTKKNFKYFFVFLIVLLTVFFSGEMWYVVYIFPFLFLFFVNMILQQPKLNKLIMIVSLVFILWIQFNVFIKIIKNKKTYQKEYQELVNFLNFYTKDCKIIFLQMIPDPYFDLDKKKQYKEFAPYGLFANQLFLDFEQKRLETYKQIDCFVISNIEKKEPVLENYLQNQSFQKISFPKFSLISSGIVYKKLIQL